MPKIDLTFADGDRVRIEAKSGETILKAARRAGIQLSSDCEVGDCQTCRATCLAGEIEYDELATISLTQAEVDGGEILPCVAMAAGDLAVRLPYERSRLIAAKRFSIKVEEIRRLSASVVGLIGRMVGPVPLKFLPGQYANLQVPGTTEWRSYSMANAPGDARLLEFHVRLLDDGVMSRYLAERAVPGDTIQCVGPQGSFYLRGGMRRMLMVAGGTGIAPMASMLRQMIAAREPRPVTLCFGVTEATDLFLVEELKQMASSFPQFDLRIAVAKGVSNPGVHTGFVTDLIGAESLADADVYLCGPPAMTDRAREIATGLGAVPAAIFSERFLPSARSDAPARAEAFSG
ncbi:2Fe-2S iron-sulfur cluster binding domain-containing protein [Bradyrhizobium sp. NP1]|uniref:2Fe-2S iron-sulfur cluster binding domain-containing protein n=1 Tax=Bradyrhizobium sp. NP1 TaxID=3049772 RepID=UPI0025A6293D|nr:2Fe-2S iron-sulfur cluster binding domain-containing protein [Bradyrhizobium sp. NP1]WJR78820.1 2Fe-2S iron-sulfur cluster binding domain-containing protein [Bradyrhizobium sp. NP1]